MSETQSAENTGNSFAALGNIASTFAEASKAVRDVESAKESHRSPRSSSPVRVSTWTYHPRQYRRYARPTFRYPNSHYAPLTKKDVIMIIALLLFLGAINFGLKVLSTRLNH